MSALTTFGSGANPTAAPNSPGQVWGRGRKPWAVEASYADLSPGGFWVCSSNLSLQSRDGDRRGHGESETAVGEMETEGHGNRQRNMETNRDIETEGHGDSSYHHRGFSG